MFRDQWGTVASIRDIRTEDGDKKTCYSPLAAAAGAGRSPRMRQSLTPLGALPLNRYFLEDSESVSSIFFCCSSVDSFRLLFAFVSMCRSHQAHFVYGREKEAGLRPNRVLNSRRSRGA